MSPRSDTRALPLFSVQVAGVPTLYVEEALWSARTGVRSGVTAPLRALVESTASGPIRRASRRVSEPSGQLISSRSVADAEAGERAARHSLRQQIAKLERELSAIVAEGFPHIPAPAPDGRAAAAPRLLGLGELERSRDSLAGRAQQLRRLAAERAEHERRAHERLER